ncbi:MAG: hypothetical protein LBB25_02510 [Holosporaceae bacterium]|nr:hypothetical protein [Holosporaceae bacterium]
MKKFLGILMIVCAVTHAKAVRVGPNAGSLDSNSATIDVHQLGPGRVMEVKVYAFGKNRERTNVTSLFSVIGLNSCNQNDIKLVAIDTTGLSDYSNEYQVEVIGSNGRIVKVDIKKDFSNKD